MITQIILTLLLTIGVISFANLIKLTFMPTEKLAKRWIEYIITCLITVSSLASYFIVWLIDFIDKI